MKIIDNDSDVVAIALWIIALGFVILAIEKTTQLSNKPNCDAKQWMNTALQPSPPSKNGSDANQEDQQFKDIVQQLQQLRTGLSDIQKDLLKDEKKGKNGWWFMIDKDLANELVAVGGWIAVIGAFLAAIGSTGQVEPDANDSAASSNNDNDELRDQLSTQKKWLQKQQIQIQLIQMQQELSQLTTLMDKRKQ